MSEKWKGRVSRHSLNVDGWAAEAATKWVRSWVRKRSDMYKIDSAYAIKYLQAIMNGLCTLDEFQHYIVKSI
jgi:hypothetical protein